MANLEWEEYGVSGDCCVISSCLWLSVEKHTYDSEFMWRLMFNGNPHSQAHSETMALAKKEAEVAYNEFLSKTKLLNNADRYTLLICEPNGLEVKILACSELGLTWIAEQVGSGMRARIELHVFFDKEGKENYLNGLYDEVEEAKR